MMMMMMIIVMEMNSMVLMRNLLPSDTAVCWWLKAWLAGNGTGELHSRERPDATCPQG